MSVHSQTKSNSAICWGWCLGALHS
jgi:hypothetical protein